MHRMVMFALVMNNRLVFPEEYFQRDRKVCVLGERSGIGASSDASMCE